jgi:uncharacterized membrane protein
MAKTQQASGRRTTARPGAARKGGAGRPGPSGGQQGSGRQGNGQQRASQDRGSQQRGSAQKAAGGALLVTAEESASTAPRLWFQLTTFVLSLAGLGFSVYLTITHLHPAALVCAEKGLVNCNAVTTSAQSKVFGIFPVAELGLAYYVFTTAINSPWAWRMRRREVRWIRLASTIAGMGFVLYLLFAELIQIGNICLYCTGVHIVTFILFVLIVFDSVFRQAPGNSLAPADAKRTKG